MSGLLNMGHLLLRGTKIDAWHATSAVPKARRSQGSAEEPKGVQPSLTLIMRYS